LKGTKLILVLEETDFSLVFNFTQHVERQTDRNRQGQREREREREVRGGGGGGGKERCRER